MCEYYITRVTLCILEVPKIIVYNYNSIYKAYMHALPTLQ